MSGLDPDDEMIARLIGTAIAAAWCVVAAAAIVVIGATYTVAVHMGWMAS